MFIQEPNNTPASNGPRSSTDAQVVERIAPPSARPQFRTKPTFNAQAWWGISLGAVVLLYIGVALLFQAEYNANTRTVFNEVVEQARMPWYHQHPWFGALIFAGLPGLAFAWVFVTLMHTKFIAEELKRDLSDLILHVQHNGYRLQGQLDQIAASIDRSENQP